MTTPFATALAATIGIEGGYSDHPSDSGGKTNFGVTEKLARAYGYNGDMHNFPIEFAVRIYREHFWDAMRLDEIAVHSPRIASELFDTGVNAGSATAVKLLQRSLNALNRQGRDFSDITVDGLVGRLTISTLHTFLTFRFKDGEHVLLRALNALQAVYYMELSERREKDEDFMFGWLLHRVVI